MEGHLNAKLFSLARVVSRTLARLGFPQSTYRGFAATPTPPHPTLLGLKWEGPSTALPPPQALPCPAVAGG